MYYNLPYRFDTKPLLIRTAVGWVG